MSSLPEEIHKHPYITQKEGVCGGRPIIAGTRIPVSCVIECYKEGMDIDEILDQFPHLTPAQVHDAFSFYYDHQEEIEEEIDLGRDEEYWKTKYPPGKGISQPVQSKDED